MPTTDWKNPTAVAVENLPERRPTLYTKVLITSLTSVTKWLPIAYGLSNPIWVILPTLSISNIIIVGLIQGKVICHIFLNLPAPSTVAASYSSGFIPAIAAK